MKSNAFIKSKFLSHFKALLCSMLESRSMGFPFIWDTSPCPSMVNFTDPKYFVKANAWTTGTARPPGCLMMVGYRPLGTSDDNFLASNKHITPFECENNIIQQVHFIHNTCRWETCDCVHPLLGPNEVPPLLSLDPCGNQSGQGQSGYQCLDLEYLRDLII